MQFLRLVWILAVAALGSLAVAPAVLAAKSDRITLANGDQITGEIKRVERGRLQLSTDSMGTVLIEWEDITQVVSPSVYIVELEDGTRIDGSLAGTRGRELLLAYQGRERSVAMDAIVFVDPLKVDERLLQRWDGSISVGLDATKANSTWALSGTASARQRSENALLSLDGSVYSRSQEELDDNIRANLTGIYRRFLRDRWFWAGLGTFERNDELGIDLRSLAGGGAGRFLHQSGRALWSVTGGVSVVNEQRAGGQDGTSNLEAFFNTEFEYFTYNTPKTRLVTSLTLFPSLTDAGRVRGNLDLSLRRELISDLFFEVSFYGSYDSQPPDVGAETDYGIVTSLGYTF
jgi:hypothetical protein